MPEPHDITAIAVVFINKAQLCLKIQPGEGMSAREFDCALLPRLPGCPLLEEGASGYMLMTAITAFQTYRPSS